MTMDSYQYRTLYYNSHTSTHAVQVYTGDNACSDDEFYRYIQTTDYPNLSYSEALEKSGLVRLDSRREEITQCTFRQVKCSTHPLHYLLPPRKVSTSQMTLRPTYPFSAPKCKKQDMVEI